MAALEFPGSPSVGQTYSANNGTWTWDGTSWNATNSLTSTTITDALGYSPMPKKRVIAIPNGTSITLNADTTDLAVQTNTQSAGTLTINAPVGTPIDGQQIMLHISSTSVQTFAWNPIFKGSTDAPLPVSSSGAGKHDYMGFTYSNAASKWQLIAKNFGF